MTPSWLERAWDAALEEDQERTAARPKPWQQLLKGFRLPKHGRWSLEMPRFKNPLDVPAPLTWKFGGLLGSFLWMIVPRKWLWALFATGVLMYQNVQDNHTMPRTSIYNAADFPGATIEAQITNAIAAAVLHGVLMVNIPARNNLGVPMLPFNASLVTFNSAVRMVAEGFRSDVYHVHAYGAFTDGATDSSVAIQAADTAAEANNGTVWFGPFTYRVSGIAGTVQNDGNVAFKIAAPVRWFGESGATLQLAPAQSSGDFIFINPVGSSILGSQATPIVIDGITFDANSLTAGFGIHAWYTANVTIRNCRFTRFSNTGGGGSYGVRVDGNVASPATPFVWANAAPTGFGQNNAVINCVFDNFNNGGSNAANSVQFYEQDGGLIQGNTCVNTGWMGLYGPNRGVRILGNTIIDGWDNGIRLQIDGTAGDNQRSRDHTIQGNRIRNCVVDGIRLNCSRTTCDGNVSEQNGNSGIKSDASSELIITSNVCMGNVNNGIYLAKSTVTGQGGHDAAIIANNLTLDDLNNGILIQGGGDTGAIPATNIRITGNRCFRCAVQGIRVDDADTRLQIMHNTSGEHGAAGGAGYGFLIQAINLSWGGATIAFNRSVGLITGNAATAKQPFGIGFIAATGKTLSPCYVYFNDLSDHPNTSTFFGTAVSTTANPGGGTVSGQYLVGNLYRNNNKGVNAAAVAANALQASDIIVQIDEAGQFIPGLNAVAQDHAFVVNPAIATQPLNVLNGTYQEFNITTNIAVVIQTPTNNPATNISEELTVTFFNASGGALTTAPTFTVGAGAFLVAAAVVNPGNGTGVTYVFRWSPTAVGGARWREVARTAAF